ncbi:GNAT family N-acetyltransferase [Haloarchaeobius salinus]|uniref:GNAT family N-acetyltransferase n=1 Tax=Haloarchaeobius salinus TaxID=1198298 RepID=UPI00210C40F7|nr:GNAT family N-acetyltransferase [Haloarchaeobius salinus]
MYVRDAKNREEVWLLDHIEAMGLDDTAFRSRDYVVAIDEEAGAKAGFGRIRVHIAGDGERTKSGRRDPDEDDICELTSIGVLEGWRDQGVGAHIIERLVEYAGDAGFETVYALTDAGGYLAQFGFEAMEVDDLPPVLQERLSEKRESTTPDARPMRLRVTDFSMPGRFRERFKEAGEEESPEPEETPEDFGIDPEKATYKYDTGR